ncbi:MAG TPA: twin-arginine translocase subunit TatC [Chloroflexota bacterium]|nr:twin-arginine translocase subunit TatC [Chloroflexota bacterium]
MSTVVDKVKDWVGGGPDPGTDDEDYGGPELTIVEHLIELRGRLTTCAIALFVGTIIGLLFYQQILDLLKHPAPSTLRLIATGITDAPMIIFKVSIMTGASLAMPVFVYQIFAFVGPGLTRSELRLVKRLIPFISLLFAGGILFGYFVVLPVATNWLLSFNSVAEQLIRIDNYLEFVTTVMFWMGLAFETPLIIFLLAKVNLITVKRLGQYRKYALLAVTILAAAITPSPDPFSMTMVAIPLYMLYELGILVARFA